MNRYLTCRPELDSTVKRGRFGFCILFSRGPIQQLGVSTRPTRPSEIHGFQLRYLSVHRRHRADASGIISNSFVHEAMQTGFLVPKWRQSALSHPIYDKMLPERVGNLAPFVPLPTKLSHLLARDDAAPPRITSDCALMTPRTNPCCIYQQFWSFSSVIHRLALGGKIDDWIVGKVGQDMWED